MIQFVRADGEESPGSLISTCTCNFISFSDERRRNQAEDMEFVCDNFGIGEVLLSEVFEGVTEIYNDVLHVFSSLDMGEGLY